MDLWSSSDDEEEPAGRSRTESPAPSAGRSSAFKGVKASGGGRRAGAAWGGSYGAASESPAGWSDDASRGGERGASKGGDGWVAAEERMVALSRGVVPGSCGKGIGVKFRRSLTGDHVVTGLHQGGAAEESQGVFPGDRILAVNGMPLQGKLASQVFHLLAMASADQVLLTLQK
ncbi:hypothetical protein T484DRAFT_1921758, partial [Baffinella frigidus]